METLLTLVFFCTYLAIALEHPIKVNKAAAALLGAGLLWTIYALAQTDPAALNLQLGESLLGTAQIVFFLIAAMAIVEVVDEYEGARRMLTTALERRGVLAVALAVLLLVPVFKAWTHLPPFMGILLGLGIVWLVADLMHRHKDDAQKQRITPVSALSRVDMGSIVFLSAFCWRWRS